jgi:hypothetical protein
MTYVPETGLQIIIDRCKRELASLELQRVCIAAKVESITHMRDHAELLREREVKDQAGHDTGC